MCGIAGIFNPISSMPFERNAKVRIMAQALSHRGPDDEGYYTDDRAALGHRRLSIIDLATGHQPMIGRDGNHVLIFNGEIYNFRELRSELGEYPFKTHSDTEVILAGYDKWGNDVVNKIKGMFAFALYDIKNRKILAARDPIGKKPFYYHLASNGTLYFASELGALAASGILDGAISEDGLQLYFSLGYIPAPYSIYRSVNKLPAGHALIHDISGMRVYKYWDIDLESHDLRDESFLIEQLESLLDKAVSNRLIADVPLGALLSGGIDSNLVVSTMSNLSEDPVRTFTAGFDEKARLTGTRDERLLAEQASRIYKTCHESITVDAQMSSLLVDLIPFLGEPFADSSILPTYLVCRAAREKVTVALTGDGGDEPFGGYSFRYLPHLFENRIRKQIPASILKPLCHALAKCWPISGRLPRYLRLSTIFRNLSISADVAFFLDQSIAAGGNDTLLIGDGHIDELAIQLVRDLYNRAAGKDELTRILYVDARLYMTEDVLVKADRMSMANSLELRSPLLDQDIIQFAFSLPGEMKIRNGKCKYLLHELAKRRVAPQILNQPKTGFSIPIDGYLRKEWSGLFCDYVFDTNSQLKDWVSIPRIKDLWEGFLKGNSRHLQFLWSVFMLSLWLKEFHEHQIFGSFPSPAGDRAILHVSK